jgi:hypothetical protein
VLAQGVAPWYNVFSGSNIDIFGDQGFSDYAGSPSGDNSIGLTNGKTQASSVIISNFGAPFPTASICPSNPGSF